MASEDESPVDRNGVSLLPTKKTVLSFDSRLAIDDVADHLQALESNQAWAIVGQTSNDDPIIVLLIHDPSIPPGVYIGY